MSTLRTLWATVHGAGRVTEIILCAAYAAGGVSMLTGAPSSVMDVLGPVFHTVWACMLILAPVTVVTGILTRNQWVGMWLRVAGQASITGALSAYAVAIWAAYGPGTFTAWTIVGLTAASVASAVRDVRRIRETARLAREGQL